MCQKNQNATTLGHLAGILLYYVALEIHTLLPKTSGFQNDDLTWRVVYSKQKHENTKIDNNNNIKQRKTAQTLIASNSDFSAFMQECRHHL